uniref:Uncharacterized protein n=1 Tax=Hyaloperonospora arabidopsidis (strain Emoy2) TaxID=559515 RepID=M4BKE0_HYAAE
MNFKVEVCIVDVIIEEMFFRTDSMIGVGEGECDDEGAEARRRPRSPSRSSTR